MYIQNPIEGFYLPPAITAVIAAPSWLVSYETAELFDLTDSDWWIGPRDDSDMLDVEELLKVFEKLQQDNIRADWGQYRRVPEVALIAGWLGVVAIHQFYTKV